MNEYEINILPLHPNGTIIIQTVWTGDDFITMNLYSSEEKRGFRGTLSRSTLAATSNTLERNYEEFMEETRKALCTDSGLLNFTYIFNSDTKTFKWCRSTVEGFRVSYGEVLLEERPESVEEILMDSIRLNQLKERKIETLNLDIKRSDDSFNEMKALFEKCVDEKLQLESNLLTKFAALLNTKKEKIRELERAIRNRSIVTDDFETDESGDDSNVDYCSPTYALEKSPVPSTSIQSASNNESVIVPKRVRNKQANNETIEENEETKPSSTAEPQAELMDIYDRETEVLLENIM